MKYVVREKMLALGDDYWIEDEDGRRAFYVDGKVLRVRETLELQDPEGTVVAVVRKKLMALRDAMTVERGGDVLVTVRRKPLAFVRDVYRAELATGEELEVRGDLIGKEYDIEYDGERLARISRRLLSLRDAYVVDVEREDADAAMLIAIAVCVDRLTSKED
jgi:uncharacterized protein YxjI